MSSIAALAGSSSSAQDVELEAFLASASGNRAQQHDASLKAYFRELKKVISLSDVLLQVLDARDPLGSRSLGTERLIRSQGKRIVLVLNKVDLVPQENVLAWLKYLRHDFPTLAFKSSTQMQRNNLAQKHVGSGGGGGGGSSATSLAPHQQTQAALGAQSLISLLKNYSRSLNLKTSLTVGIFGAPNVGKSSLINSLKRARVCSVASTPGHTKVMQGVMLDKHVRLLDCPGIVFADAGDREHESVVQLRNVIKVESVADPTVPVEAILRRVPLHTIRKLYNLDVKSTSVPAEALDPTTPVPDPDAQDFLLRLALQRGRLGRGGIPDTDATARSMLHDWNTGKIPFFTQPPKLHPSAILSKDKRKEEQAAQDGMQVDGAANSISAVAAAAAASSANAESDQAQMQTDKQEEPAVEHSAAIVSSFSEAFDLAGLLGEADAELLGGSGSGSAGEVLTSKTIDGKGKGKSKGKAAAEADSTSAAASTTEANGGKTALGKRRRGGEKATLAEDERADEPAWKARQRHRAQSARNGTEDSAAGDTADGAGALSRAALKKAKKRAKRREEVERKEGMGGPGGLLDQLELAFTIDADGDEGMDGGSDGGDVQPRKARRGDTGQRNAGGGGAKSQQQGRFAAIAVEGEGEEAPAPQAAAAAKKDDEDEEW
ncbi:nuclear GTP-binding protein nug1 [Tilletia horrida]|nr:nuclear GTP-binding protein nug1 [Tilletia horrida]